MTNRLEQLHKLHKTDPTDPFVTYGIALEYGKGKEPEQAIKWFDLTLELDSNYCYAYYQKARLLSDQGLADQARAVLKQGLDASTRAGDDHARDELSQLLDSIA